VVNHTIKATPPERLQQLSGDGSDPDPDLDSNILEQESENVSPATSDLCLITFRTVHHYWYMQPSANESLVLHTC